MALKEGETQKPAERFQAHWTVLEDKGKNFNFGIKLLD